ncbi:MAG: ABC transporter ATP-binding protein, partial [Gammaproteobacteria bacterium]|nr:ABC transporter ATP-binding protein [Gammaproteobacteria bacterium]
AFPLKNRGASVTQIRDRVTEIARMLDLETELHKRASRLTADGKQKISLGRGLVRSDVNVIMFDEPLTVIDPHLKWQLRSKLKELHQQVGVTMIYVTHDQTEALTIADQVAVMLEGEVIQIGTPTDLFEKPMHTFVGHFIGSPGMNVLPCTVENGTAVFAGNPLIPSNNTHAVETNVKTEIGVRPEFVSFADNGIPVEVVKVDDVGRYQIVEVQHAQHTIKMILREDQTPPSENAQVVFDTAKTYLYTDQRMAA